MENFNIIPYVLTALASLGGSWVAIYSALKVHNWRLDEHKALLSEHKKKHEHHEQRITKLEAFHYVEKKT